MKTSESIINISKALSIAQGQLKNPECNKEVKVNSKEGKFLYAYKYATLPKCFDAARGPLSSNGISHASSQTATVNGPMLTVRLMHESGEWMESEIQLRGGLAPKDLAGDVTFFKRYLFNGLAGIAADEDIEEANGDSGPRDLGEDKKPAPKPASKPAPKPRETETPKEAIIPKITKEMAAELVELAKHAGLTPVKEFFWPDVYQNYSVKSPGELNQMDYEDIKLRLNEKIAKAGVQ